MKQKPNPYANPYAEYITGTLGLPEDTDVRMKYVRVARHVEVLVIRVDNKYYAEVVDTDVFDGWQHMFDLDDTLDYGGGTGNPAVYPAFNSELELAKHVSTLYGVPCAGHQLKIEDLPTAVRTRLKSYNLPKHRLRINQVDTAGAITYEWKLIDKETGTVLDHCDSYVTQEKCTADGFEQSLSLT